MTFLLLLLLAGVSGWVEPALHPVVAARTSQVELAQAMEFPRVLWGGRKENKVYLEMAAPIDDRQADELQRRGFTNLYRLRFPPRDIDLAAFGGVNAIAVEGDGTLVGVADPRRQGCAVAATR
ncbi:MAG: hypothetical protein HXY19_06975 [Thermoanaerobaculaceae bacterium]|nr:hypothetical protein [Thermoanaerobaculaceae bacterium]